MTSWQTKKLGDIATIKRGGSPRPIQDYLIGIHEEGYNWLKIGDVPEGSRYIYSTTAKIKPSGLNKTTLVKKGDFILSNSMSFGRPYIMMTDACIHDGWLALQNIDSTTNKQFLYYLLTSEHMQNKFKNYSAGSGVQNLKKETVQDIDFKAPDKPEQERIVEILETWDEFVEQLEKKIQLKEQLKIGVMQQIFSRKSHLQSFSNTWQTRYLEEVATVERGRPLSSKQLTPGNYPVIAGGKTSPYHHAKFTHEDVITVSASGANAGYVAYQAQKIWASDCSVVFGKTSDYSTLYIYYWLHFMQDRIYRLQTGGAQPHVQPPDLRRLKIAIPKKDEQLEIVAILGTIDLEISKLEQLKAQLTLQKKYLLKNLITGKIRTPETLQPKGAKQ